MSETFPGAAGCRDAFDMLSSATVDWLVTKDIQEIPQNRLEFEKQVKELTQQLQLCRGGMANTATDGSGYLSTLLSSTDSFAVSEMLSSAAQWPDLGDVDLGDMGADLMAGPGLYADTFVF